jgi:hypothetical protein
MHYVSIIFKTQSNSSLKSKLTKIHDQLQEKSYNDQYITSDFELLDDEPSKCEYLTVYEATSWIEDDKNTFEMSLRFDGDHFDKTCLDFVKSLKENQELEEIEYYWLDVSNFYFESYRLNSIGLTYHHGDIQSAYEKCIKYYDDRSQDNDWLFANLCDELNMWDQLDFMFNEILNDE